MGGCRATHPINAKGIYQRWACFSRRFSRWRRHAWQSRYAMAQLYRMTKNEAQPLGLRLLVMSPTARPIDVDPPDVCACKVNHTSRGIPAEISMGASPD